MSAYTSKLRLESYFHRKGYGGELDLGRMIAWVSISRGHESKFQQLLKIYH